MADLVYVLVIVVLFALGVAYVRGCERIVRSNPDADPASEGAS